MNWRTVCVVCMLIMCMFAFSISTFAEVRCEENKMILNDNITLTTAKMQNKKVLMCGLIAEDEREFPYAAIYDMEGKCEWNYTDRDKPGEIYRDISFVNQMIVILRSEGVNGRFAVEAFERENIEEPELVFSNALFNPYHIFTTATNKFIIDSSSTSSGYKIEQFDVAGNSQWAIELEGVLQFHTIKGDGKSYIAIGRRHIAASKSNSPYCGTIIKFDENGTTLWRYDAEFPSEFVDAIELDNGNVLAIGVDYIDGAQGFIAEYSSKGEIWKKEITSSRVGVSGENLDSMAMYESKVFVSSHAVKEKEGTLVLHMFDVEGNILNEVVISSEGVFPQMSQLFFENGDLYIFSCGRTQQLNLEWESPLNYPYAIVFKQFVING